MSRPSASELAKMTQLAHEISETVEHEASAVTAALGLHRAFVDGRGPMVSLERSIVRAAAEQGASIAGVYTHRVAGSGLEVFSSDGGTFRAYRFKLTRRDRQGKVHLLANTASSMLRTSEPDGLFARAENWVLGCVLSADHTVDELFVAEIIDWHGERPVHLELGDEYPLMTPTPPPGFVSDDEDNLDFEDELDDDLEEGDTGVA